MESRRQPGLGLDFEPADVIGGGGFPDNKALKVIRPCRESTRGWTLESGSDVTKVLENVNEHGPALKVFWISLDEIGHGVVRRELA